MANPRKIWRIMSDLAPSLTKTRTNKDIKLTADQFAAFFARADDSDSITELQDDELREEVHAFNVDPCSTEEVHKILNNMPTNKAEGIDGIPMKAIKWGSTTLTTAYKINK